MDMALGGSVRRERRQSRVAVLLPIRHWPAGKAGEPHKGWCDNISLGGMFIRTDQPLRAGDAIVIEMKLPDGYAIELSATVRWTTADGMGVQFGSLGARDTYALSEYVASLKEEASEDA
jgi:type IV pilus assembly protein PilZ